MSLKNKNQSAQTKATFSVPKNVLSPYTTTDNPSSKKLNKLTAKQTVQNTSESILGIDPAINPAAIKQIESLLKLTFLSEKDENSAVCMANSSEVRNAFKDVFDINDLLNYSYALLHSPSYLEKRKEGSKIDSFEVVYPIDANQFWKLADLGSKLRDISLLGLSADEKRNKDINKTLKKIAEIKIE